jgi:P27 family predicted phage terminase small subunit
MDPPDFLLPEARAEWERVTKELKERGKLDTIDLPSLVCYCQAYGRWVQAERELTEKGRILVIRNDKGEVKSVQASPYVAIAVKMLEKVRQLAADLGLNPMSRAQLGDDKSKPRGVAAFARKRG